MTKSSTTAPQWAYRGNARRRVIVVAGVFPAVVAAGGALLMLLWAPQLPDPIAIHWGAAGEPDGYGPLGAMIALLLGVVLIFSAAATAGVLTVKAASQSSQQIRVMPAISVWLSVFLTIGITGSVAVQRGLADASAAGSVVPVMLLGAGIGVVLGVAAWFFTPLPARAQSSHDHATPALDLAPEERASWTGAARPASKTVVLYFSLIGGLSLGSVLVMALTIAPWMWWSVLLVTLVFVASAVCFFWRVSVDHRGVTVRSDLGFPRLSIPLEEISGTRVIEVTPLGDFGGWGWRWAGGRTGIVVRAGEALEVTRTSGKVLVITVDDAATAVALLDGLLSRRRPSAPPVGA